jgi:hypothetical protein
MGKEKLCPRITLIARIFSVGLLEGGRMVHGLGCWKVKALFTNFSVGGLGWVGAWRGKALSTDYTDCTDFFPVGGGSCVVGEEKLCPRTR